MSLIHIKEYLRDRAKTPKDPASRKKSLDTVFKPEDLSLMRLAMPLEFKHTFNSWPGKLPGFSQPMYIECAPLSTVPPEFPCPQGQHEQNEPWWWLSLTW
jgi:hypothetical protein